MYPIYNHLTGLLSDRNGLNNCNDSSYYIRSPGLQARSIIASN